MKSALKIISSRLVLSDMEQIFNSLSSIKNQLFKAYKTGFNGMTKGKPSLAHAYMEMRKVYTKSADQDSLKVLKKAYYEVSKELGI